MNEQALAFISKITENAESTLKKTGRIPVMWHLVKEGLSYSLDQHIDTDNDASENEVTTKLAAEWISPDYAVQIMNIFMTSPSGESFESIATICFYPDESPVAWISKITRLSNDQVAFISPWITQKKVPLSGALYSPFEKLEVTPSQESIGTVRELLGYAKKSMLKVV
jgi:hypothetical protein